MNKTAVLGLVTGRVQGVWFRRFVATQARSHGVSGYAKNLPDGRVEVLLHGAPQAVANVAEQVAVGPPAARVDRVDWRDVAVPAAEGFEVL